MSKSNWFNLKILTGPNELKAFYFFIIVLVLVHLALLIPPINGVSLYVVGIFFMYIAGPIVGIIAASKDWRSVENIKED